MPALYGNTLNKDMRRDPPPVFGAIEAGGTKFVCAIGTGPDDLKTTRIPTGRPEETVARAVRWFRTQDEIRGLGIASFGPVDLDPDSPTWGHITATPKVEWRGFDLAGTVRGELGVPVAFDTDVNAALLGETVWGAARGGVTSCIYLTVGTGIGGGACVRGKFLNGVTHPEMGHIRVPHDRTADPFAGICPFHGDCLEGLASGPAIAARWGARAEDLAADHPAWALEAEYLARGLASLTLVLSPALVLLGGGVMQQAQLFPFVRERLARLLAGYVPAPEVLPPLLGQAAGISGAIALARAIPLVAKR
jgi:fructokinase